MRPFPALHVIADNAAVQSSEFARVAGALLQRGAERIALHVRAHGMPGAAFYDAVDALTQTAQQSGAWLIVNDRVDVALAAGVERIILGQHSLPVACVRTVRALAGTLTTIGYSAHGAEEAARAATDTADFVQLGTVYETASHPGRQGGGVQLVRDTAAAVQVPIVAIGGITPARVHEVMRAGASGVAVLRSVWQSQDALTAVQEYLDVLARVSQEK